MTTTPAEAVSTTVADALFMRYWSVTYSWLTEVAELAVGLAQAAAGEAERERIAAGVRQLAVTSRPGGGARMIEMVPLAELRQLIDGMDVPGA